MQFKKGSFEVNTVIYPVAIKVISLLLHRIEIVNDTSITRLQIFFNFNMFSTIRDLVMHFGTAVDIR